MKLSVLMTINAVVAAAFGLALVLAPGQMLALYGADVNPQLTGLAQLYGAALLSFAVLTWSARYAADSGARRAIVLALFVGDSIGFVLSLMSQLAGTYNALGWSTVVIYLLLAAGFGYFQFMRPASE